MFDGRWRHAVDRTTKPVGTVLVRAGITADVLTIFGLVMSVVTAFVVGSGHLVAGIFLLFPTGLPDLFDGPVAKASGRALGARCVLRLGGRPHLRRLSLRWRGVVPRGAPPRRDGPAALRHPGGDLAHLLPTGQGRAIGAVGQGRAHGTGRALHPARLLFHRRRHLDGGAGPGPVGVLRAVVCDRHRDASSTSGKRPRGHRLRWRSGPCPPTPTWTSPGGLWPGGAKDGSTRVGARGERPGPIATPWGARRWSRAVPPSPRAGGAPVAAGVPSSRSGRIWRARREARAAARSARRPSSRGF